jgi:hypothetical protein
LFRIAVFARVSVVLPSELTHIPDFRAIVKFSAYGVSEVEIPREFYEVKGEHFVDGSGEGIRAILVRHEDSEKSAKDS